MPASIKKEKSKKNEGMLDQVYAVQKPYAGCQPSSLIHPVDPLVGLGGSEVAQDQVHGVYPDQDQAAMVAQTLYNEHALQEKALEDKKHKVTEKIKRTVTLLEKRRAGCVDEIKKNPMEAAKYKTEAAKYTQQIDELVTKLERIVKSAKPIKERAKKDIKESIVTERREYDQKAMEKLGFDIYPGCRSAAWEFATKELGISADEILGKMSDDDVLNAIYDSLMIMGYFNDEEMLGEASNADLLKKDNLTPQLYQKVKDLKGFKESDWKWNPDKDVWEKDKPIEKPQKKS